jgi:AcrR family transcriptional regulator
MKKPGLSTHPSKRASRTRQQILQAAAEVFTAQGYSGATTRRIAETARVSELTLFRHFGTKKNLFLETIRQNSALPSIEMALAGQMSGDPRQDLTLIGVQLLKTLIQRREVILMTFYEAERLPELRQIIVQVPKAQRRLLAGYLFHLTEQGLIKTTNIEISAQAFLGMLFAYAVYQGLEKEISIQDESEIRSIVEVFVDIFLEGILVQDEQPDGGQS